MSFPKGSMAKLANLKCCLPKGIQIIVMENKIPMIKCEMQMVRPPKISHSTFITSDKQPLELSRSLTVLLKGQSANKPSLNVCIPKGIPTMVMHNKKLAIKYSMAIRTPQKTNQTMFPSSFIVYSTLIS